PSKTKLQRRMILDPCAKDNIMSVEVYNAISGIELQPYQGESIAVTRQSDQQPRGIVEIQWHFYKGINLHQTSFYVVPNADFDLLLGDPSIGQ
ncbi:hypothetical protein ASPBRDRAFT_85611, partial [Aspergillus brasiliensis CBS 101740]